MTLKPVRSSRRGYRHRRARLAAQYSWKPWKGWNPSHTFNGKFDPKAGFKLVLMMGLVVSVALGLDYSFGGPLFHGYSTGPSHDPTTPIQKYTAPNAGLSEFNTAGSVVYTTSCQAELTSPCMKLTATVPPPPLPGQFTLPFGSLKITSATITPQTATTVYRRATGISSNSTFVFDVSGGHAQTGSYLITTTRTTTVTFFGPQPTVTCTCLSSYNGIAEILTFSPGLSSSLFTLNWVTGQNINCLCALAESVSPIGDLSPVVGKELETELVWQPVNNATLLASTSVDHAWGIFLTTNSSLWQTNNPTWTPYTDGTVAMFIEIYKSANPHSFNEVVFIQQRPGETIQQENSGCRSGSAFICVAQTSDPILGTSASLFWMALNFTGSSNAAQVGSTPNCPTNFAVGGAGCSYSSYSTKTLGSNVQLPTIQLPGNTYYVGYWLGSGQTGSGMLYCFDTGNLCGQQLTIIAAGCTSASMEWDYCIPNPTAAVPATTDSGGFFGAVWRGLTSAGSWFAGVTQPIWGPASNLIGTVGGGLLSAFLGAFEAAGSYMINTAFPQLEAILKTILNTIGNLIFPNSNIGTLLFAFLGDVVTLLTNTAYGIPAFFGNFPAFFSNFVSWLQVDFQLLNPGFIIASAILAFGLAMFGAGISIFTVGVQLILFSYGFILMFSFIVFVGDDGIGGVLTYLGTAEALAFKIINFVAVITNLGLDLLVTVISLIPKPFVQMNAGKIPRLPVLDSRTTITFPRFDFAELRAGNMVSAWLLMVGFYLDVFYESANPTLPGSLSSLVPGTASAMQQLSTLLPLFKIFVFISGGLVLFYLVMSPIQRLGVDLGVFEEFGVGLGGRQGPGPSGVKLNLHPTKHLAGPAKRIMEEGRSLGSVEVAGKGSGGFVIAQPSEPAVSPESTEA